MRKIKLTRGKEAIVDDSDYDWLNQWKWTFLVGGYAYRHDYSTGDRVTVFMHRLIIGAPHRKQVDHVNGNGLDNRRCNLRLATPAENGRNSRTRRRGKTSKYKGVCWHKATNTWRSYITYNGKQHSLGYYHRESDAAIAYNEAAIRNFGDFARLNDV